MAKPSLYSLCEGERVEFEMDIVGEAKESDVNLPGVFGSVSDLLGAFMSGKGSGKLVVTNARVLIVKSVKGLCSVTESRTFRSFPRSALSGWVGYQKEKTFFCYNSFVLRVRFSEGGSNVTYKLTPAANAITSDEQAQAVLTKLAEFSQGQ